MAREYNFSVWVGRNKNPYSFVIRGWISQEKKLNIGVRMIHSGNIDIWRLIRMSGTLIIF